MNCSYCYQFHTPLEMDFSTARKSVDLLLTSTDKVELDLYGGEPFLRFDLMREIISYAKIRARFLKKKITFRTTTNGSLIDSPTLHFLNQHHVHLTFSIDGTKRAHNACRGRGSFQRVLESIQRAKEYPFISCSVMSVVSPGNVQYLSESMRFLLELKMPVRVSFDYLSKWEDLHFHQLRKQYAILFQDILKYYRKYGNIPLSLFKIKSQRHRPNRCTAATEVFAVSPDGKIYGCPMLVPNSKHALAGGYLNHFEQLCLGDVSESPSIAELRFRGYSKQLLFPQSQNELRTDKNKCAECNFVLNCDICPADALTFSADKHTIPSIYCRINALKQKYREMIREHIYEHDQSSVWKIANWI